MIGFLNHQKIEKQKQVIDKYEYRCTRRSRWFKLHIMDDDTLLGLIVLLITVSVFLGYALGTNHG